MLEITPGNGRQWSRLGPRAVFGQAILALADGTPNLMLLSAGLAESSGLNRFRNSYPDRFVNVRITQQNMIGVAAGLAKEGFIVFATSFAPFISMRCCEQVRMNLGYMNAEREDHRPRKRARHGAAWELALRTGRRRRHAVHSKRDPCVAGRLRGNRQDGVRRSGARGPDVHPPDGRRTRARRVQRGLRLRDREGDDQLRKGSGVTIIAAGSMVHESLEAAKVLEADGLSATVINMHTLKPLDTALIDTAVRSSTLIVTVEEHSRIGGLGGAVAEYKSTLGGAPRSSRSRCRTSTGKAGAYRYFFDKYGLTGVQIARGIRETLRRGAVA